MLTQKPGSFLSVNNSSEGAVKKKSVRIRVVKSYILLPMVNGFVLWWFFSKSYSVGGSFEEKLSTMIALGDGFSIGEKLS